MLVIFKPAEIGRNTVVPGAPLTAVVCFLLSFMIRCVAFVITRYIGLVAGLIKA